MLSEDAMSTGAKADGKVEETATPPAYPLFYKDPAVLRKEDHGDLRLVPTPDYAFAKDTNSVLVTASEFTQAARFYPIVFVGEQPLPATVLGLTTFNLFVDGEGRWDAARPYKPAYIQRYPFVAVSIPGAPAPSLGIDLACERLVTEGKAYKTALPLFAQGKPAQLARDAANFCFEWNRDFQATTVFCQALLEHGLLIDQQLAATLPGGKRYNTTGFKIVDTRKFHALPEAVLVEWHRKGFLALVYAHLASQLCWNDLAKKMGSQNSSEQAAED